MLSFHGKFPAAQWVEHCTAKAVPVRVEILTRGTCRFFFVVVFLFSFTFLIFFFFWRFVSFLILYLAFKQSTYNGDLIWQISWESGVCQFSFSFHLFIFFFFCSYTCFFDLISLSLCMLNVAITWFIYFLESNFLKYIGNLVEEWVTRQVTQPFFQREFLIGLL